MVRGLRCERHDRLRQECGHGIVSAKLQRELCVKATMGHTNVSDESRDQGRETGFAVELRPHVDSWTPAKNTPTTHRAVLQ